MNKSQLRDCKNCIYLSENIAAGTYEEFCSCPNTFFEPGQFGTKQNWADTCDFFHLDTEYINLTQMNENKQPVWRKELGNFTLFEYPEAPNKLHCTISYQDDEDDGSFAFGSWGMERDLITQAECYYCCQWLIDQDTNVCLTSFKANLDYALSYFNDEDDDDDDEEQ